MIDYHKLRSSLRGIPALHAITIQKIIDLVKANEIEDVPTPKTFVERMTIEYDELENKIQSIKLFMMTGRFKELSKDEQRWLEKQSMAMNAYSSVLQIRLDMYGVSR